MFNIGPGELVAIFVVALIVLGPARLPEAVRTVGRVVGELRRISAAEERPPHVVRQIVEMRGLDVGVRVRLAHEALP